jgi:hypothetical protein
VKPLSEYTEQELIQGAKMGSLDTLFESMRRLRVAVEGLSKASTVLTVVIIVLMVVQIAVAVWPKAAP